MVLARSLSPRRGLAVAAATLLTACAVVGCANKSDSTAEQKPKYRPADAAETEVAKNEADSSPADRPAADAPAASAPAAKTDHAASATPAPSAKSPPSVPMTAPGTTIPSADVDRGPAPGAKGAKNVASTPSNSLKLPAGGVPELLAFIDELSSRQPRGTTQQEQVADFQQIQNARLAACQKVLELTDDDNVKMTVLQAMQEVHTLYAQLQLPGALQMMRDFANRSAKSEDKIVSQYGRLLQFQLRVMDLAAQPTASGDAVIGEIKTFLESTKDAADDFRLNAFTLAASATELLEQQGHTDDAVRALRLIADEMRKSDMAQLVDTAPLMEARANVVEANLSQLADDVLKEEPGAGEKIVAAINKLLKEKDPPINYVSAIQQVATLLEFSGNTDLARQLYTSLSDAYKDHKSEKTAKIVGEMTANALKRLDLPGKPFEVEGVLIGGEPFDWAKYRGKWVLVDFWATWCEPCLRELPNIRRNYEEFKDKGFEVVGVNMNTDPQELERFFALQELPWPTVVSQEVLDKQEFPMWNDLPMAKKYGVDAIPFVVLVNKEGKVDSLHLRGPKLTARLNELFGDAKPAPTGE